MLAKSQATAAWELRNFYQVTSDLSGAGSMPAVLRICQIVDAAEQAPVVVIEGRSVDLPAEHAELMMQHDDLDVVRASRTHMGAQGRGNRDRAAFK